MVMKSGKIKAKTTIYLVKSENFTFEGGEGEFTPTFICCTNELDDKSSNFR